MLVVEKAAKHDVGTGGAAISVVSPPCRSTGKYLGFFHSSRVIVRFQHSRDSTRRDETRRDEREFVNCVPRQICLQTC